MLVHAVDVSFQYSSAAVTASAVCDISIMNVLSGQ
jgi:hypothetical protein